MKTINVYNRSTGKVGYIIPDLGNLDRQFQPYETKKLTEEELVKLSYIPGGLELLKEYLIVEDEELREELIGEVEIEYSLKREEIETLLREGSLELFEDFLTYAPVGAIEIAKDLAVKMELPDMTKRTLIQKATGLNVTRAIEIKNDNEADTEDDKTSQTEERSGRRTSADAYNRLKK